MLKITKASDPIEVKTIVACVYAVPGVGKTSLGSTADRPLLLDFDHGSYRAANRGDVVQIEQWSDVTDIAPDDLKPYRTVVVDTAGRALDCLTADIIASNPKQGRGGALTLQGYGELKSAFVGWTRYVRSFGLDVVLLCHSDEQRSGDELIERLDMQGGSKGEVYKSADLMGRIYLRNGKRILNFSPTDTAFGKNPAQFPPLEVPDFATTPAFLSEVIANTKAALNKMSATQTAVATTLGEWKTRIDGAAALADFDALLAPCKAADQAVKENVWRLLVKAAKAKGFAFNRTSGAFDIAASKAA
jgi:hypothetical protein